MIKKGFHFFGNDKADGDGIAPDIINRIFKPYFPTGEEGQGTYIGAYMSKMIMENDMNGKLAASNINGGACFTLTPPNLSKPIAASA